MDLVERKDRFYVGVDLGGTKIMVGTVNSVGQIFSRAKKKTRAGKGPEEVVRRIIDAIGEALDDGGMDLSKARGIGIGAPGTLDMANGIVTFAPNLGWRDVRLKQLVESRLGIPTFIDNDVNMGTLGEYTAGAGRGAKDVVGIFVGTGIGGGIIIGGRLHYGFNYTAGEVGHMVIQVNGPKCGCGNRGCWEALASKTAIARRIKGALDKGRSSILKDLVEDWSKPFKSSLLAEAIERGDKLADRILKETCVYLGIGVGGIINLLGPERVILGGGVIEALGDKMMPIIKETALNYTIGNAGDNVDIVRAKLGDDAGIIGAAVLAKQKVDRDEEN
ncbi:MAG: ROK family protein [bacterium]